MLLLLLLLFLQIALAPYTCADTYASNDEFRLVSECCNPDNAPAQAQHPAERPCLDSDRSSLLCLRYSCKQKEVFSRNSSEGTRTRALGSASDLEPIITFGRCLSPVGNPPPTQPKYITKLDIVRNGTLVYKNRSDHIISLPPSAYCVITALENNSYGRGLGRVQDLESKQLQICMDLSRIHNIDDDDPTLIIIYLISYTLAAIVLLITMCCFIMSHEKQSIHGWTQFTHVLAFFSLLVFWNLDDSFILARNTGTTACKGVAVGSHFFYIALFSWLLVVNYDIRQAFLNIGQKEFRPRFSTTTRYLMYSAFGWGVPLLVVLVTIIFSIAFDTDVEEAETLYMPLYGIHGCSLAFRSYWLFLTLPNGILLVLVFVLYVKMVQMLRRQRRSSRSGTTTVLGVKILFLMGPFWFLDLITCMHVAVTKDEFVWYITLFDMIVILQAIPLFVIYICRPDLLQFFQEKYPRLKNVFIGIGNLFCVPQPQPTNTSQTPSTIEMGESRNAKLRINRRPSLPSTFASRSMGGTAIGQL